MAETLGVAASIIAVVQLASVVGDYLMTYNEGGEDKNRLVVQLTNAKLMLNLVKDNVEDQRHPEWQKTAEILMMRLGPLDQFNSTMEQIIEKITPSHQSLRVAFRRALSWPLVESEVRALLASLPALSMDQIQKMKWPFRREKVAELVRCLEWNISLFTIALQFNNA